MSSTSGVLSCETVQNGGSNVPIKCLAKIYPLQGCGKPPRSCSSFRESGFCLCKNMYKLLAAYRQDNVRTENESDQETQSDSSSDSSSEKPSCSCPDYEGDVETKSKDENEDEETCSDSEEDLPSKCSICDRIFTSPVITKCKHYFCRRCILKRYKKCSRCMVCNARLMGIFKPAAKLIAHLKKEPEPVPARGYSRTERITTCRLN